MKGHAVPLVVYEDEVGNLVTASTPGAIRKVVGEADAHFNEQGDLVADAHITDPSASKVTEEMAVSMGPFSIAQEELDAENMLDILSTVREANRRAEAEVFHNQLIEALTKHPLPRVVKMPPPAPDVGLSEKASRRAKNKRARQARKRNRG